MITFTGSRETGVAVTKAAADDLKHVHLELGGKNAIIVMDDADLDLAVEGIVWSAFGTSGQRCTAASRVIVHERRLRRSSQSRLVAAAEKLRLGPGWEDDTDVGPVINQAALEKIHSYTEIGKDEGAKLLTGGEVATDGDLGKGFFYRPTIFADVDPQMRIAQEEIFGPTTALIRCATSTRRSASSNGIAYGLSSSIFTRDVNKAFRAMRDLQAGITYINAGTIGAEVHLPFGGTKDTGNGHREAGQAALDVFTEWKSIYVDYSGKLQRAQIDNRDREPQARRLRAARGARRRARAVFAAGAGRIGEVRALLLVHGGDRHVPRRRGDEPRRRRAGARAARRRAPARDRVPGGQARRGRRRAAAPRIRTRSRRSTSTRSRVKARLFTDGGARGNPGPAAYGYVLEAEDGTVLAAHGEAIGVATNNVAEYRGLVAGLEKAVELGVRRARGRLRLRAARQADARRVPGQERGAAASSRSRRRALARRSAGSRTRPCGASTTSSPTGS